MFITEDTYLNNRQSYIKSTTKRDSKESGFASIKESNKGHKYTNASAPTDTDQPGEDSQDTQKHGPILEDLPDKETHHNPADSCDPNNPIHPIRS